MTTESEVDVPNVTSQLVHAVQTFEKHVTAYGSLAHGSVPLLSWQAHDGAHAVDILTDLNVARSDPNVEVVRTTMMNIHYSQMLESADQIAALSATLQGALRSDPGEVAAAAPAAQEEAAPAAAPAVIPALPPAAAHEALPAIVVRAAVPALPVPSAIPGAAPLTQAAPQAQPTPYVAPHNQQPPQ
jgi:hypothetical protein